MIELSVVVKDEKSKVIEKEIYEDSRLMLDKESPYLRGIVQNAINKLGVDPNGEAPDICIKVKMVWQ